MESVFNKTREEVAKLIDNNKHREVTWKTNNSSSGIYMLYIDNFADERIIPFYIGQTEDFQQRHKKHLTELLSLNRLEKSCYEYALQKELYSGKYRACSVDIPISEIHERVGYSSASHFVKIFRNITGMTPSAYRLDGYMLTPENIQIDVASDVDI